MCHLWSSWRTRNSWLKVIMDVQRQDPLYIIHVFEILYFSAKNGYIMNHSYHMFAAFRPCHPLPQRDGNSPGRPCKISSENGDAINEDNDIIILRSLGYDSKSWYFPAIIVLVFFFVKNWECHLSTDYGRMGMIPSDLKMISHGKLNMNLLSLTGTSNIRSSISSLRFWW